MNIAKALMLTIVSSVVFTMLGGLVGLGLGRFVPNYYRNIARAGDDPGFDPLAFGVGQGVTQGLTAGIAIGIVLVLVLGWLNTRLPTVNLIDQKRGDER